MGDENSAEKPKKPRDLVGAFFSYNEETKRSTCQVSGCKASLAGKHTSNLEKHIQRFHPNETNAITGERIKLARAARRNQPNGPETLNSSSASADSESSSWESSSIGNVNLLSPPPAPSAKRKKNPPKLPIQMSKRMLMDACVEMVTVNGRPLSAVEDSGFRKIIDPIIEALRQQEYSVAITRFNVLQEVRREATRLRGLIREEVRGRLVSLKLDTATRLDRSLLGVNIQFVLNGKIALRNLCVRELTLRHTAENLVKELREVLSEFGITPNMIYSGTTDNAANMVKTVRELAPRPQLPDADDQEDAEGDRDEDPADERMEEEMVEQFTQEEEWVISTLSNLPELYEDLGAFAMRCSAHTLQLAVADSLKDDQVTAALNAGRNAVKKLRAPTVAAALKTLHLPKPPLDNVTRWMSTLRMISVLLKLRDISNTFLEKGDIPTDAQWQILEDVANALAPAEIATKKLQAEQLVVGDFVETWLRCKLDTKASRTRTGDRLHDAMERREKILFDSPTILCGLYMDPRWHILLNDDQRKTAEDHLITIWRRLEQLKNENSTTQPETEAMTTRDTSEPFSTEEEEEDPIERLLRMREKEKETAGTSQSQHVDIRAKLKQFSKGPRVPRHENILEYWERRRASNPEMYILAITVLAAPMTQVSVERLFSHVKFIISNLRSSMKADVVNDILFVRCNRLFMEKDK